MVFRPNPNLIDKNLARISHSGTGYDPEIRAKQEIREFVETVQEMYDKLRPYAISDPQKHLLDSEMERFQENYANRYNDLLASHPRIASPTITGTPKPPYATIRKMIIDYNNKLSEAMAYKSKTRKDILRQLKEIETPSPLLLYPAGYITKLEKGKIIEIPETELKLLMGPKKRRKNGSKCVSPIIVSRHRREGGTVIVESYERKCPARRR